MDSSKPAILIVHGAYFLPETWQPFMDRLKASGFEVRCPRLPTCGDKRPPTATLADDVAAVQTAGRELQSAGHPIIVLAHSFGGLVATEAITKDLRAPEPRNRSTPGVIRMIYMCAFAPLPGQSIGDIFSKHGFLCDVKLEVNEDGTAFAQNPAEAWYNDIPESERAAYVEKNVSHNFGLIGDSKVSEVPWKDVKSTYVYCDRDLAIHKPLQENMVKDAINDGGRWETTTLGLGHCSFLSAPEQVIDVVKKVWEAS
jgi:pimeloyl-ACP methyl ester carboxylesterase